MARHLNSGWRIRPDRPARGWHLTRTRLGLLGLMPVLLLLVGLGMPLLQSSAAPLPAGSRIPYRGGNWYLHGANVPWYNWGCDFGCNQNGGVSGNRTTLGAGFAKLKDSGVKNARWWVFPGDPWQINRDSSGAPTGLNSAIYADFDAALQLAETYDIYYDFVLFSAPTAVPSAWMTDSTQRTKLANALGPLFARYSGHPRILSWEIVNEPEWDIWNSRIGQSAVQATVRAIASSVHANSTTYVTVGAANLDGLPLWVGQGLDYYRAHWYDHMTGNWCARCTDYATVKARYNLDAPLVIGELYAGPSTDALQRFEDFYAKGYAGAFPWSLFADRTSDRMEVDLAAAKTFAGRHADIGPRGGVTNTPTPTGTSLPPTATPTTAPAATATPTTTPATTPSYTTSASVSPGAIAAGGSVAITASFISATTTSALVDIEVYSPSGTKVHQVFFDNQGFTAGQTRTYTINWTTPTTAAAGQYIVRLGLFSPGWGTLYTWNHAAAQFTVGAAATATPTPQPAAPATSTPTPQPTATATPRATATPTPQPTATPAPPPAAAATATPTPAPLSFTSSASLSTNAVARGQRLTITAKVKSTRTITGLVDVEVYDPAGKKVYQRAYDNVQLSGGVLREFRQTWRVPTNAVRGTYTVKIGIFKPGWGELWHWNDRAVTFTVQ